MTINLSPATEFLTHADGLRIHVRSWRPDVPPAAVVVICHGFNSHGGQYQHVAETLAAGGYSVYAADLRGRGHSDGERFYVEHIAHYVADLSATVKLAKAREPGLPVFVLGHSAGGVVSATYALDNEREIAGFICESFAFEVPAPKLALAAIKGLSRIAPRVPVLRLKNGDFSRDPATVQRLNSDPLALNERQPAITVAAMVRADERLRRDFPNMSLPLLILHGTNDRATLARGSQFFFDTAGSSDKTLKLYEGHYHDLLSDLGHDAVLEDIMSWLRARVASARLRFVA
jgi:acylglycerol lipase